MEAYPLDHFKKGWFVGDFEPALIATREAEVAVKQYRAGEREKAHHHKVAVELTVIVFGRVRMSGREFGSAQIVCIPAGESTDFEALEDTVTVVVKVPSVRGDKYED